MTSAAEQIVDDVYRLGDEMVSWYAVEDEERITLVDAGMPKQYGRIPEFLSSLGRTIDDIAAIVLTHAHADHLGSSARIQDESGADVFVHRDDAALARGEAERRYERHFVRDLIHPYAWKSFLVFVRGGALKPVSVADPSSFDDAASLDIPGRPRVIHTPGHTDGSCCLELADRGVLFSGDALVTLNIATGERGPRVMPGSFNADSAQALESVERLRGVQASVMLPGHGNPWRGAIHDAVAMALDIGPC